MCLNQFIKKTKQISLKPILTQKFNKQNNLIIHFIRNLNFNKFSTPLKTKSQYRFAKLLLHIGKLSKQNKN